MSPSALFFDMDGTLVDTEPLWLRAETALMAELNYAWTPDDQIHCLGGPLTRVGEYMSVKTDRAESASYFMNDLIERVAALFRTGVNFMPGAQNLLESAVTAGIPCALVSASPRILVDAILSQLSGDFFKLSISADDVAETKPNPMCYLQAADQLQVDISESIILEDSLTGISSAQASGAWVLAIPHLVTPSADDRTRIVKSLEGLSLADMKKLFQDVNNLKKELPFE